MEQGPHAVVRMRARREAGISGGSAEAGGPEFTREFDVAGVPYNKRGAIMEEQIEVLRKLWTEPVGVKVRL